VIEHGLRDPLDGLGNEPTYRPRLRSRAIKLGCFSLLALRQGSDRVPAGIAVDVGVLSGGERKEHAKDRKRANELHDSPLWILLPCSVFVLNCKHSARDKLKDGWESQLKIAY
jgi:hypothetical protein